MTFASARRSQLGLDPATLATVASITMSFINKHPKDKSRFQANEEAYRFAAAGDTNALTFLRYRTGRYGVESYVPPFGSFPGGPVGGWATQAAKDHAGQMYTAATRVSVGLDPGLSPDTGSGLPPFAGDDDPPPYTGGPPQGLPPVVTTASMSMTPLLIVAAVVIAMTQRRRN